MTVENSADDADLIRDTLAQSGLQLSFSWINTTQELRKALRSSVWDIVLSNTNVPQLKVDEILQLLMDYGHDVPLIVISEQEDEDAAISLMEKGACDYVVRKNLKRLVPIVRRSLREAENARRINITQVALQKSEARFRAITANLPGVVFQFLLTPDQNESFPYVSNASETLLGLSPHMLMANATLFSRLILPEDKKHYERLLRVSADKLSTLNWEGRIQVKGDSDIKWISLRATPKMAADGGILWGGIMINITRNKLAEREITHSREQLVELSSYLQKAKEHERARIAREIHDDIGGTLTAIKCELVPCMDHSPRLSDFYQKKAAIIENLVDHVIDSTRRISMDLRPGILDFGIVAAVQWQAKEFSRRTDISCHVSCDEEEILLDADLSVAIFRLFQEILTNISKHAQATDVWVSLVEAEEKITMEVRDNGCGINPQDMKKQDSFGIRGMHERCQQLKGSFQVSGESGKGTKVSILIPVQEMKPAYADDPIDVSDFKSEYEPGQLSLMTINNRRKQ
ncbi:ATP-binding protein [Nitrosomonas sp. Nm51]|uniref:hybrid sensor histidine kinase/response regulator n=1 Tax=Nitrosomonas sp. Nm51 TaxID=133720 RepID=UPI00210D0F42|nr:ATP-binding protein [Nitrosomonas sp. Nm51]